MIHLKSPFCGFVLVGWRGIFCSHPQTFQSSPHQKGSRGFHPNNLLGGESPEPGATGLLVGTRFPPLQPESSPPAPLPAFASTLCTFLWALVECLSVCTSNTVVMIAGLILLNKILISEHDIMPVCPKTKNSTQVSDLQIGHFPVPSSWAFFPLSFSKITVAASIQTWALNSPISQNWQIVFRWKSSVRHSCVKANKPFNLVSWGI